MNKIVSMLVQTVNTNFRHCPSDGLEGETGGLSDDAYVSVLLMQ
jgi:hypothetical protein